MTTLNELQQELRPWQEHNFPGRAAWEPVMGVAEEAGELSHAFLKRHQTIRGSAEAHEAEIRDAIGDIIVYLADVSNAMGFDLQACLDETWATVRERDWRPA